MNPLMSNDRQYQRNNPRPRLNGKENDPSDLDDRYTKSNNDIYRYSHWRPQGMVYGYDQYGFYPQVSPYHNGGMVSSFDEEQYSIPEVMKSRQSGKKKIKLEYIASRNKRNVTFSKRKKGIMKKAYELNVLTGTEVLLLVASESGHVYTFATPKLRPIIDEHENLIKNCLNAQGPEEQDYQSSEYPKNEYPKNEYPKNEYPKNEYPKNEYPGNDYPRNDYPGNEYPGNEYPRNDYPESTYPRSEYKRNDLDRNNIDLMYMSDEGSE